MKPGGSLRRSLHSRAFAVSGVASGVLLLFVAVAVLQLVVQHSKWQGRAGWVTMGMAFVAGPIIGCGIVALIAWIVCRRSDRVFNGVFATLLLIFTGTRLLFMSGAIPSKPANRGGAAAAAPSASPGSALAAPPAPRPPRVGPDTAGSSPSATQSDPAPPRVEPEPDTISPGVLATFRTELDAVVAAFAADAALAFDIAARPKKGKPDLKEQIESLRATQVASGALAERLRGIDDEARARLEAGGFDSGRSLGKAIEFSSEFDGFMRAAACDEVGRLCETALEYYTILYDNAAKWTLDASGQVTTRDQELERALFGPRHQTEFAAGQREAVLSRLNGG